MSQQQAEPIDPEPSGLESDPFANDALPAFFFVGGQRRFIVEQVVHALYFSGAIVLLTGERGVGKSRVLTEITAELGGVTDICRVDATVMTAGDEIRRQVATTLGLPIPYAESDARLIAALSQLQPAGVEPLPIAVIIDDAHLLAVAVLAECQLLARSAGGRLRLLLVGEPDLAVAWQQADAGAVEHIDLPALDKQETGDYLRTRLQAAGYRADAPLSDTLLQELFRRSRGNIAAIHEAAPQLLESIANKTSSGGIKGLPWAHIAAIAGLLVVVIVIAVALLRSDHGSSGRVDPTQVSAVKDGRKSIPLALPVPVVSLPPVAESIAPPVAAEPPANAVPVASPPPAAKIAPVVSLPPAPVAIKKPQRSVTALPRPAANLTTDEHALLALPANRYALQLMAAESQSTVTKLVGGPARGVKLYSYHAQLKSGSRIVVVAGPYPDKKAAQAALAKLPSTLRDLKPWPRTIGSIQAEIRAQHSR